jgi:nicotinamidase-related amidase
MSQEGFSASGTLGGFELAWNRATSEPETTALVIVDMVNHQVTPGTGLIKQLTDSGVDCDYLVERVNSTVIPNTARLLAAFRDLGAAIAFLRVGGITTSLRDTLPSGRHGVRQWGAIDGDWPCEVVPSLAPQKGELSLIKLGSGGFTTSNLDQHLRFMGIKTVFYTGVLSNVCVLLTMGAGFDLGYDGYMVTDATATLSGELQFATEQIVSAVMAKCVSTADALEMLKTRAPAAV